MFGVNTYILLSVVCLSLNTVSCSHQGPDICSGGDISQENDVHFEDWLNKVWYVHIVLDDTRTFSRNASLMYRLDVTGRNSVGYYVGSSLATGECVTVMFQNRQLNNRKNRNRACISALVLLPATSTPPWEWISTILDREKTQLMFYTCQEFDHSNNICTTTVVLGATTRPRLLNGEKELFESKIRAFGRPLPPGGLPVVDQPTANDCEDEIARALGIRRRTRKRYRY